MRWIKIASICVLGVVFLATPPSIAGPREGLDRLAALAGQWEGQRADGVPAKVSYAVVSGGHAIAETLEVGDHPPMLTVYHLDGDDLRLTHFCMVGNQPRMKARRFGPEDKTLAFTFVDATNLAEPTDGHMHGLEITFEDPHRLRHRWTWMEDGQTRPSTFEFTRRK